VEGTKRNMMNINQTLVIEREWEKILSHLFSKRTAKVIAAIIAENTSKREKAKFFKEIKTKPYKDFEFSSRLFATKLDHAFNWGTVSFISHKECLEKNITRWAALYRALQDLSVDNKKKLKEVLITKTAEEIYERYSKK
jgi:hypothetical protein